MVPVDVCINLMCAMAWKVGTMPANDDIPVYHCTSGAINRLSWGKIEEIGLKILINNPYEGVFWYPGGSYKENYYVNRFFQVLTQLRGIHTFSFETIYACIAAIKYDLYQQLTA